MYIYLAVNIYGFRCWGLVDDGQIGWVDERNVLLSAAHVRVAGTHLIRFFLFVTISVVLQQNMMP